MAVTKVVMPKLSEAMETGKIIKWLKKEGDRIQGGDILAEIETDKADVEMEAFGAGVLRKVLVPAGEKAPVGTLIGVIAGRGADIAAVLASAPAPAAAGVGAAGSASARNDTRSAPPAAPTPSAAPAPAPPPRPAVVSTPAPAAPAVNAPAVGIPAPTAPTAVATGRVKASPLAKKIAAQAGVDLRLIRGTGPGGRIIRRDVDAAAVTVTAVPAAAPTVPAVEYEDRPLSQIRATIAKRLPLSKAPVPHFYVTSEVAMDRAWELREELNALEGQPKISVNDFVVRACALALLKHPGVNASFQGESIRVWHRAHIGIAVALEAGLGVGRRMALTLSCDHRVMDGAMGARFLQDVKRLLEEPLRLLV